jgi:60 kDa SS-A/Ro ribonucleoprotein
MKNIIKELEKIKTYQSADTVNHENFPAWKMNDEVHLEQLAMTGTLGNSFYASSSEVTSEALELLERADAEALSRAIIRGRNEGFIRTFPLLGLVVLSKKSPELFKKTFPKVVLTGNDLEDFIDMTRRMRGMGRAVKRAIHTYLRESVTPYYAMKYRKQLADAIRVSRFAGDDPLYAYILSAYSQVKGLSKEKVAEVYGKYPEFAARKEFLDLLENGKLAQAAEVLLKNRLDVESLGAYYHKFDQQIWGSAAAVTPVMRFLKYLAKFTREGVDIQSIAAKKLSVDALKAAKVFPFRLYTAYKALPHDFRRPENDAMLAELVNNGLCNAAKYPSLSELLENLLDDYALAYDWGSFNQHSWVIAPDISGSMCWSSASGNLTFAEISGMFTGFFSRGLDNVKVVPWDTEVHPYEIGRTAPVMDHIRQIGKMSCGGTYMEAPVEYMIANNIKTDYALFITDSMEYGKGWLAAWKRYKALNPSAQAFLLPTRTATAPAPISESSG